MRTVPLRVWGGGRPGSSGSKPGWPCPAMLPQQDLYMLLWGRAPCSWGPNLLQGIVGWGHLDCGSSLGGFCALFVLPLLNYLAPGSCSPLWHQESSACCVVQHLVRSYSTQLCCMCVHVHRVLTLRSQPPRLNQWTQSQGLGPEIKYYTTVFYVVLYSKVHKSITTCRRCTCGNVCHTCELIYDWTCECMFVSLKVRSLTVYV